MRVYFDTEFTGLHQHTTLISIGCISDEGHTFYAEFTDYDFAQVDSWIADNVLANLRGDLLKTPAMVGINHEMRGTREQVAVSLRWWIGQWKSVEMWSDCYAYDWVLFCQLFGGALNIPKNIYYIPFDLSTLLKLKGYDPDISRDGLAGQFGGAGLAGLNGQRHNALYDARQIRAIVHGLES